MQIRRAAQDDALQPAELATEETPADSTQEDKSEIDFDAESSDESSCATAPALPRKNWPQLQRPKHPTWDEAPVNYLLSRTGEESWHVYFYDTRTHTRARYPDGGPPHKPHTRYTV